MKVMKLQHYWIILIIKRPLQKRLLLKLLKKRIN